MVMKVVAVWWCLNIVWCAFVIVLGAFGGRGLGGGGYYAVGVRCGVVRAVTRRERAHVRCVRVCVGCAHDADTGNIAATVVHGGMTYRHVRSGERMCAVRWCSGQWRTDARGFVVGCGRTSGGDVHVMVVLSYLYLYMRAGNSAGGGGWVEVGGGDVARME